MKFDMHDEEDTPLPDTLPPPEPETIRLSPDEFAEVQAMIDNPPPPTPALVEAMHRDHETMEQAIEELLEEEEADIERRLRRIENTMAGIERTFQHLSDVLGTMIDDQVRTNRNLRTGMDITRNFVVQLSGKKSGTTKALQRLCDELDRQRQGEEEAPE